MADSSPQGRGNENLLAALGPGLPARDRGVEETDAQFFGNTVQVPGRVRRRCRVIDKYGPRLHAVEGAVARNGYGL